MNWGKWIVVSFVLFAIFIGVLVTVCVRQDISLVANDYYKQELDYQKQIDRDKNAQELFVKPEISIERNELKISFKDFNKIQAGEVKLFRPSNAASDMLFRLERSEEPIQSFDLQAKEKGMYKAQMKWSMDGKEFYIEQTVYL